METTFSSWFLELSKVSKNGYGLFLYALQPAKCTSSSFMGAILEEYLVIVKTHYLLSETNQENYWCAVDRDKISPHPL